MSQDAPKSSVSYPFDAQYRPVSCVALPVASVHAVETAFTRYQDVSDAMNRLLNAYEHMANAHDDLFHAMDTIVNLLTHGPLIRKAKAVRILAKLAPTHYDAICKAGGVPHIVELLKGGAESEAARDAAKVLDKLAKDSKSRGDLIEAAGGIPPLIEWLDHANHVEAKAISFSALQHLCATCADRERRISPHLFPDDTMDGVSVLLSMNAKK